MNNLFGRYSERPSLPQPFEQLTSRQRSIRTSTYTQHMPFMYSEYTTPRLAPWPHDIPLLTRVVTFIGAFAELIWLDLCGAIGFRALHATVTRVPVATGSTHYDALTLVRVAVRDACVFYIKPVHCLQRSAAVTRMLRRRGIPATLVIGYQPTPVEGHAWVELNGTVVWDWTFKLPHFRILDRL